MRDFLLIRHSYDDHSYIDGKNDTSLTSRGVEIARAALASAPRLVGDRRVVLRHSVKRRAKETADILCDIFDKQNIDYTISPDSNLTELYQGRFHNLDLLSHEERIQLLQNCWEEFDEHRLSNNLDYRFGDHINALRGKIDSRFTSEPFGESQRGFAARIGRALLSMRDDANDDLYPIGITHRGAIREVKNLLRSINERVPMEQVVDFEIHGMRYCEMVDCVVDSSQVARQAILTHIKAMRDE